MKHICILLCSLSLFIISYTQETFKLKGKIVDKGQPVAGATVTVVGTTTATITDINGSFELTVKKGDKISVSNVGFAGNDFEVTENKAVMLDLSSKTASFNFTSPGSGSTSIKNYWVGAKLGYNFLSKSADDFFVGSASVAINLLKVSEKSKNTFGIVGNIGNFKFQHDTAEDKSIQKLTQSINGLFVGLGYTHDELSSDNKQAFREFVNLGARLASYTNVGKDSETVNLPQFATTIGAEYELTGFSNAGALSISAGLSLFVFNKNDYLKIFNEKRGHLVTFDASIILPLSKNLGFFVNGTYSKLGSPVYIMGIIVHPATDKK